MSDLTKDVILRISAKNLSTADFKQATAAVNELTSAVDRQVQAASKGVIKEKELTETLAKLGDVSKNLQGFATLIQNLKGLDSQIAAQITKLAEARAAWEAQKTTNEQAANVTVRMTNRLAGLEKAYKAAETALAGQQQRQVEYTAKLQQNGFDVQNLANAERQLTTVADQAGVVVAKLTAARDNYAKILRLNNEAEKEAARVAKEAEAAELARVAAIQQVTNALEQQRAAEQAARLAATQAGAKEYTDRIAAQRKAEADFRASQAKGIQDLRDARMEAVRKEVEANNQTREKALLDERKRQEEMDKLSRQAAAGLRDINERHAKERMVAVQQEIEQNNRLRQTQIITERNAERNSLGLVNRLRAERVIRQDIAREQTEFNNRERQRATEETQRTGTVSGRRGGQTGRPNLLNLQPYEMTNLGYQGVDIAQGLLSGVSPGIIAAQQGPQILQIFGTAALKWAPIIVAALGTITVAVGAFGRVLREEASTREFSALLTDNANAANYTVGRLNDLRKAARDMGMSWADAGTAIKTAIDNNVAENRLKQLLQAAQDVKDLTGKGVPESMKEFTTAITGNADALLKLNNEHNFLSRQEQQHVRDQFAAGAANDARRETVDKLSKTLRDRAEVGLSPWTKATREASAAWDNLLTSLSKTSTFQTLNKWLTDTISNLGDFSTKLDELIKKKGLGQTIVDALVGPDSVVARSLDAIKAKLGLPPIKWDAEQYPGRGPSPYTPGGTGPGTAGVVVPIPDGRFRAGNLPLDTDTLKTLANLLSAASKLLPEGYSVQAISTERPGALVKGTLTPSEHGFGRAIDVKIVDANGKDVSGSMGAGGPLYQQLDAAMAAAAAKAGVGPLAIGSTFGNRPDAGHYSLGGPEAVQNQARRGVTALGSLGTAAPTGPVTTGPTREQVTDGQKLVEQEREKERISRANSIEAEKQAKFAQIKREVEAETQDPSAQAQLIRIRQYEVEKSLNQEARDLRAKEDKEKIDDARHYNEIRAAGDKAVAEAQAQNITDWRSLQRIRDAAQGQERDRIARLDAENDRYQQAVKIVDDLKRGLDGTYSTNLEARIAAITLAYKDQEEALKKLRDASPLGDKARFDAKIAELPALRDRAIGQATGKALEAQADAAVAARNDLINSANKLRDAGAISISEQQQKIKDAYALTTPEIEKATAALEEWLKTAKQLGATDLDIEKVKAKITELRVEAQHVDPFLKGLTKTVEESFTNRATEAFDSTTEALGGLIAKTKDWKDVWVSVRTAASNFFAGILKDIADYIIKQQIARGLSSLLAPGSAADAGSGLIGSAVSAVSPQQTALLTSQTALSTAITANTTALGVNTAAITTSGYFTAAKTGLDVLKPGTSIGGVTVSTRDFASLAEAESSPMAGSALSGAAGSGIGSWFSSATSGITGFFSKIWDWLGGLFSGVGAGASSLFGSIGSLFLHSGGVVGNTAMRTVPGYWFMNAPRYHAGAMIGLAANEQAAILQRGEEVLANDNPRNMKNWSSGQSQPRDINIRNVLVADPELVPSHMGSARGEKVIMNVLTRNAATVRQLVR